jgi:hypothetical protein
VSPAVQRAVTWVVLPLDALCGLVCAAVFMGEPRRLLTGALAVLFLYWSGRDWERLWGTLPP